MIPVGLEKQVASDLPGAEAALLAASVGGPHTGPSLWVLNGEIVSEIEALKLLTGVEATQIAGGGIGGAEGAVWLMVTGSDGQVNEAVALIDGIQGEPPFTSAP